MINYCNIKNASAHSVSIIEKGYVDYYAQRQAINTKYGMSEDYVINHIAEEIRYAMASKGKLCGDDKLIDLIAKYQKKYENTIEIDKEHEIKKAKNDFRSKCCMEIGINEELVSKAFDIILDTFDSMLPNNSDLTDYATKTKEHFVSLLFCMIEFVHENKNTTATTIM